MRLGYGLGTQTFLVFREAVGHRLVQDILVSLYFIFESGNQANYSNFFDETKC